MKFRTSLLTISAFCAVLLSTGSFAANPGTTASFGISTTLQQGITLSKVRDLSFPQETSNVVATYTVAPTDPTSAQFSATGTPNSDADLSFGSASIALACVAGACTPGTNTITVNNFTCNATLCSYTFDAEGKITSMGFGATESVTATTPAGTYTGTQDISLTYK